MKAPDGEVGVCALSFDNGGGKFLLTNAHVVYDVDDRSKPKGPVRLRLPKDGRFHVIGEAVSGGAFSGNVATADFGIVRLNPGIKVDEFFIRGTKQPLTRDRFEYFGSLTQREYFYSVGGKWFRCGFPEKVVRDVTVTVDGVPIAYRGAWALRMASGSVARKGHSGALILRRGQSGKSWGSGLLFAGNDTGDMILAFPMEGTVRRVERKVGPIT